MHLAMGSRKPHTEVIDGVQADPHCDPVLFREAMNYRAQMGDIVQFTYPKSGTHWVAYIIQLILSRGQPVATYEDFTANVRYMGIVDFKRWKPTLPFRLFITHQPPCQQQMNDEAKYVYVARNPWDVCVSFFHMATNVAGYRFQDGMFAEFLDAFLAGECGNGSYFDHIAFGYALKDKPNVLFVTYEELHADLRSAVLRLADFLGKEYSRDMKENEELLRTILERCTAEYMRPVLVINYRENRNPEWQEALLRVKANCRDGHGGDATKYSYVREGKVGAWKDHFNAEQLRLMEEKIRQEERASSVIDQLWGGIREEAAAMSGERTFANKEE
ncbi:hypothetical protein HPB48_010655 [Haemaphysalis longicornis]|uniref:Sulfotransferase domain-containing protein n=1 Tax=Haemaphysalis longicornis TaxID=44386 RepID=A0A9J6GT75_HAELO|nr:hypothetical protein HPB48_010655 [Haemaphysalis longicornis]